MNVSEKEGGEKLEADRKQEVIQVEKINLIRKAKIERKEKDEWAKLTTRPPSDIITKVILNKNFSKQISVEEVCLLILCYSNPIWENNCVRIVFSSYAYQLKICAPSILLDLRDYITLITWLNFKVIEKLC